MTTFKGWSPTFDLYVSDQLHGQPYLPDDPFWEQHMRFAIDIVNETFNNDEIPIVDGAGQRLKIELGYALYGGDGSGGNLPGGQVEFQNGIAYVVIHASTFIHFWSLAADMFSCPEFLPQLGDPGQGPNGSPDTFGFLTGPLELPEAMELLIARRTPRCPDRMLLSVRLRDLMIETTLLHEVGHTMLGHAGYLAAQKSGPEALGAYASMAAILDPETSKLRAAMEFDADLFSARTLAARVAAGRELGFDPELGLSEEDCILMHLWARHLVAYTWAICELKGGRAPSMEDGSEWFDYPPSQARLFLSFPSYLGTLDNLGYALHEKSTAIDAFLRSLITMTDQYKQLELLKLALDSKAARLTTENAAAFFRETGLKKAFERYSYSSAEAQQAMAGQFAASLNAIEIPEPLMRHCFEKVASLSPAERTKELARYEAVVRALKDFEAVHDTDLVTVAASLRVECLGALLGGFTVNDFQAMESLSSDQIYFALAQAPVHEDDSGMIHFQVDSFIAVARAAGNRLQPGWNPRNLGRRLRNRVLQSGRKGQPPK